LDRGRPEWLLLTCQQICRPTPWASWSSPMPW